MSSAEDDAASARALASLRVIHDEIDAEAAALAASHGDRLRCRRGCTGCCLDDLTVTPIEAERIRREHAELLAEGVPHESGACAFLDDEGACRIYDARPQVCRSQGLPLRILFENEGGEIEERRDICPLNLEGGPALESLDEGAFWLVGPYEWRIQQLGEGRGGDRAHRGGSDEERVALRGLFRKGTEGAPPDPGDRL